MKCIYQFYTEFLFFWGRKFGFSCTDLFGNVISATWCVSGCTAVSSDCEISQIWRLQSSQRSSACCNRWRSTEWFCLLAVRSRLCYSTLYDCTQCTPQRQHYRRKWFHRQMPTHMADVRRDWLTNQNTDWCFVVIGLSTRQSHSPLQQLKIDPVRQLRSAIFRVAASTRVLEYYSSSKLLE